MSKSKSQSNHQANQANSNRGTKGGNKANSQLHGNRGAQLNTNKQK